MPIPRYHGPERRKLKERRTGKDRREGRETKVGGVFTTSDLGMKARSIAAGMPVGILFQRERRSGKDRRSGQERRKTK